MAKHAGSMKHAHNFGFSDSGSSGGYESMSKAEGAQSTAKSDPGCFNYAQPKNKKKGPQNHAGGAYAGS